VGAAGVEKDDYVLLQPWLSASLPVSRMRISGSDSKIGGIEHRSNTRDTENKQSEDESERGSGNARGTASVRSIYQLYNLG
jgi:hypothetical protein